jgi:hypothetical protein
MSRNLVSEYVIIAPFQSPLCIERLAPAHGLAQSILTHTSFVFAVLDKLEEKKGVNLPYSFVHFKFLFLYLKKSY